MKENYIIEGSMMENAVFVFLNSIRKKYGLIKNNKNLKIFFNDNLIEKESFLKAIISFLQMEY